MRFMMMMKADKNSEAGLPPDPKLMAEAHGSHGQVRRGDGPFGRGSRHGGLGPSSKGTRLVHSGGQVKHVDGPFAETKELVAGFAIIQAKSREEALEHARRFMKVHTDALGPSWEGSCEIRQVFGPENLGPST
jgi:PhnB protein